MVTEEIRKDMDVSSWFAEMAYDQWVQLPINGVPPSARYKHAATIVDDKLYVIGGNRNGRYLSDVQVFDFKSLTWSNIKLQMEPVADNGSKENLLAASSHIMIKWQNKLLLLGGHSKSSSNTLNVTFIDLETHQYGLLETSGKIPVSRGGHSASLVGSKVVIFGGEDRNRKLLNDVYVLDLETLTWEEIETMLTPPAPRFDHTAAVHGEHYLLVFAGCSHSIFYSDVHVLDLHTKEWSRPEIQGDLVTPRAGHAGVAIGENWYIVGGGDNKSGCSETWLFNMSKLVWSALTSVKERDPLASEGLSVCIALISGETYLVAYGGYNGKYQNEIFVMKPKPKDSSRPKILQSPAAAAAAASVTAAYAIAKSEKLDFPELPDPVKIHDSSPPQKDDATEIDSFRDEKKALESSLTEVREENTRMREKIDELNNNHSELSKELLSVQGQLVTEISRCYKLEAQIAELQKMLESLSTIENEVQALRSQKTALEQDMEVRATAARQGSGGRLLGWLAGSPPPRS